MKNFTVMSASSFPGLAIPKPEPRKRTKARARRQFRKARTRCRAERYAKDGGCCVRCGKPLTLNPGDARHEFDIANIHEKRPRSLGGSAIDLSNTETLCADCHTGKGWHAK